MSAAEPPAACSAGGFGVGLGWFLPGPDIWHLLTRLSLPDSCWLPFVVGLSLESLLSVLPSAQPRPEPLKLPVCKGLEFLQTFWGSRGGVGVHLRLQGALPWWQLCVTLQLLPAM